MVERQQKKTVGRQWWNRDKGFGICTPCIIRFRKDGSETEENIASYYGKEGYNWGLEALPPLD